MNLANQNKRISTDVGRNNWKINTLHHLQPPPRATTTMASSKPITMLVARSRPSAFLTGSIRTQLQSPAQSFLYTLPSIGLRAYATPSGPPPAGFRLPKPERWDQSKESTLDKAGKYFLLLEMARGMYVVLEQYFRPPWVFAIETSDGTMDL